MAACCAFETAAASAVIAIVSVHNFDLGSVVYCSSAYTVRVLPIGICSAVGACMCLSNRRYHLSPLL
jgi:hypothetical protein